MILCFRCCVRMPSHSTVLSSRTQLWGACGVGARTDVCAGVHNACTCVFSVPLARNRHCSDAECVGRLRQERFPFNSANATQRSTQSLDRHSLLRFPSWSQKIRETTRRSLTLPSLTHVSMMLRKKNLDCAGAVVCGSMHACSFLCACMGSRRCLRSQGEHLSHRTAISTGTKWETPAPKH